MTNEDIQTLRNMNNDASQLENDLKAIMTRYERSSEELAIEFDAIESLQLEIREFRMTLEKEIARQKKAHQTMGGRT
jgi:predicted  nucleic acid-binding Zn-ribbon protein